MAPKKKTKVQSLTASTPIYPIGVAARLLDVHPRTLRIYEDECLIAPAHKGQRRMFSENDIRWIRCLRKMIHEQGISIMGIKKLLDLAPCWEISECPVAVFVDCGASVDRAAPRTIRVAGDKGAEMVARAVGRGIAVPLCDAGKKSGRR
ncbi:MAG: MerR family transcriptional regulator [Desulfobulbaceae bacterium]|nr:MerR family transcriptional regulator [Desulfobulbaceae bacterium]